MSETDRPLTASKGAFSVIMAIALFFLIVVVLAVWSFLDGVGNIGK